MPEKRIRQAILDADWWWIAARIDMMLTEDRARREQNNQPAKLLRERFDRGEDISDKPRILSELLDEWLMTIEFQGKATNTILVYGRTSKSQIKPHMGGIEVPKLRTRELQKTFNELAKRLSPTYMRLIKSVLVQALDFAIEQHERSDNPAKALRIPKVTRKPGRSLTPEEVRAVLIAAEGHRYGLAIRLALMGLRRGELAGLRWEDFDEQTGTLMIRRQIQRVDKQWVAIPPKRGSARTLTLGPKTRVALRQYRWNQAEERDAMGWENSGYIFVSTRDGGVCSPSTIYKAFKNIAEAAGIDPARLHDCRHTAATSLLADGTDIATVSGILGHASPQTTLSVYAHALPGRVADASQRLEDIFEADPTKVRQRDGQ